MVRKSRRFVGDNQIVCKLESNSIPIEFESVSAGKIVEISKRKIDKR